MIINSNIITNKLILLRFLYFLSTIQKRDWSPCPKNVGRSLSITSTVLVFPWQILTSSCTNSHADIDSFSFIFGISAGLSRGLGPNQCSFHAFSADSRTAAWQSVYTSSSHLPERLSSLKVCSTKRLNHKSSKMCLFANLTPIIYLFATFRKACGINPILNPVWWLGAKKGVIPF